MTEREVVAGLISGRLTPRDTRILDVHRFEDRTMQQLFFAVETLVLYGFEPTTRRILVGFEAMSWEPAGIPEFVEQLRAEG